ncbi:ribosomal L18p/L5e family protein [Wolffia australiana]
MAGAQHTLRVAVSCRKIAAEVMAPASERIVAMASSAEHEFAMAAKARLNVFPRCRTFWDSKVASCVGDKLALRLRRAGISELQLPPEEALSWPLNHRLPAAALFDSLRRAGILVDGADSVDEE